MAKSEKQVTAWEFISTLTTRIKTIEEFEIVMASRPTIPGIESMPRDRQGAVIKATFAEWKSTLDPATACDIDVIIKTLARIKAASVEEGLIEHLKKQIAIEHAAELSRVIKFTAPQRQKLDALRDQL
jgi:hypothetical protein